MRESPNSNTSGQVEATNGGGHNTIHNGSSKDATTVATSPQDHGVGRLVICAAGICLCYLYSGILLERLFTGKDRLGASFVLVTQCVTNTAVALVWQHVERRFLPTDETSMKKLQQQQQATLHHRLLLFTAACYVLAMGCSNEAIQYVSYPVAVLAKSCKLIPTMLVGQTVEGKLYSTPEWLAAVCISAGIVIFHFSRLETASIHGEDDFATYGMMLLSISLIMDGVLSSCQNFLKRPRSKAFRAPNAVETMLFVNLYSLLFLVTACIYTGQWQHGVASLYNNTAGLVQKIVILNATVAFGQVFIFLSITWYTPIITTTITTTRKFVTILLSVWAFGHSFTALQWVAIALVFFGLYLVIAVQRRKSKTKVD
jgi:UDP-galactose transporter B1